MISQESFTKITRGIFLGAVGLLAVGVFFLFLGGKGNRSAIPHQETSMGKVGMTSLSRSDSWMGAGSMNGGSGGTVSVNAPSIAEPMPMNAMVSESGVLAEDASATLSMSEEKRVMRNGNLTIRVEDAEWTADEIDRIATGLGGFTVSRNISDQEPYQLLRNAEIATSKSIQSGSVVVKVPSEKFSGAVSAIKKTAKIVLNESSSANDVTAEFVDLEARIKNKYAEESAYAKILDTNTQKISDILEVTRELSRVRGEIEQLETQKKYMVSQTDMAEISVYLSEDATIGATTEKWRPWQTAKDAVNHLLSQLRGFVDGVLYFVISVLPFFLLYLIILYILYRIGKKIYLRIRR